MRSSSLRSLWYRLTGNPLHLDTRPYQDDIKRISALEPKLETASDDRLRALAADHARHIEASGAPEDIRIEAFGLVREVARRVLGQRPFDVQLLAGLGLSQGRIVEMQTGEGKTLAAVAPAYLAGLSRQGVHILTVNDYLARRDRNWMGPILEFLGLSVGVIQEGMGTLERRQAYQADITYATAKEAGFDFLRDQLCERPDALVHRPFYFALVDEADSILIDEARIPLVIAGSTEDLEQNLSRLAHLVRRLTPGEDFETDEYSRNIFLTEKGVARVERTLRSGSLHETRNLTLLTRINQALHAEVLLRRDVDYIVREGGVELVDEFTGRVADNRRWPDGLQAAIEAKEGLEPVPEGSVLGSIALQHLMGLYPRLCGMTATASPAAPELKAFYGLDTLVVPPNRPCIRDDKPDLVFTHREAKEDAIINEIEKIHKVGRPILVGTVSVAESERLADRLRRAGISCQVLNAKNDALEAEIVARAGAVGALTISTNMAGRGTDIRLGGPDEAQRDRVVALGGLYVIGTNKHESRRIDDQLRGRAGRQGDPGSSRFFISLEDDLLARFGVRDLIPPGHCPEPSSQPIRDPKVLAEVGRVQRIVEGQNFDIRKNLCKYTDMVEAQRRALQDFRRQVLLNEGSSLLKERAPERWQSLVGEIDEEVLGEVERQIALVHIDRGWAEHLAEVADIREGVPLVSLGRVGPFAMGQVPIEVFRTRVSEAFNARMSDIQDRIVETFVEVTIGPEGIDLVGAGLGRPSSTWTYLVNDEPFRDMAAKNLKRHILGEDGP